MRVDQNNRLLWACTILIVCSRIPFIFSGYGSEEDAWGLILIAKKISQLGIYEVSRFPGHPVQEYFLSLLWELPSWLLNFLTVIVSSTGVFFFMKTLRDLNIKNYLPAGIMLAFAPVFCINSTNIMDYTWALSLVIISMYFVTKDKMMVAGILLGLACGFRITAGAMLLPFFIIASRDQFSIKNIIILGTTTLLTALICFIPVYNIYGINFFTYYEYFPYPPLLKNIYKATVGAWGIIGTITVALIFFLCIKNWFSLSRDEKLGKRWILAASVCVVVLYSISYIKIPQKTAFVIPMIPFIIIPAAMLISKRTMNLLALCMIASCFLFGINLRDSIRGNNPSALAVDMNIGNTEVVIDLLNGPLLADIEKRDNKITYVKSVISKLQNTSEKTIVIAGWWQNELNYFSLGNPNSNVTYFYYVDEPKLKRAKAEGNKIFYLPEQDFYNDLRFKDAFTSRYAIPFPE